MISYDEDIGFERWREAVCRDYVLVECQRGTGQPFRASMVQAFAGPLSISTVASGAIHYRRSSRSIRLDPREELQLSLILEGDFSVEQGGRRSELNVGDMALYDAASPLELESRLFYRAVTIKLPTTLLSTRVPDAARHTAVRLSGQSGVGAIARGLVDDLAQQANVIPDALMARLCSPLLDVLGLTIAREGALTALTSNRSKALERVKRWVLDRIDDPDLSIHEMASENAMTPRTLNRLFAEDGTTATKWIQQRRLNLAYTLLTEGGVDRVSNAAYQAGFGDITHFGRVFRAKFGVRPSDLLRRRLSL